MENAQKMRRAVRRPHDDDVDALGNARNEQRVDDVDAADCDALGWTMRSSSPSTWLGAGERCGPDGERYGNDE